MLYRQSWFMSVDFRRSFLSLFFQFNVDLHLCPETWSSWSIIRCCNFSVQQLVCPCLESTLTAALRWLALTGYCRGVFFLVPARPPCIAKFSLLQMLCRPCCYQAPLSSPFLLFTVETKLSQGVSLDLPRWPVNWFMSNTPAMSHMLFSVRLLSPLLSMQVVIWQVIVASSILNLSRRCRLQSMRTDVIVLITSRPLSPGLPSHHLSCHWKISELLFASWTADRYCRLKWLLLLSLNETASDHIFCLVAIYFVSVGWGTWML